MKYECYCQNLVGVRMSKRIVHTNTNTNSYTQIAESKENNDEYLVTEISTNILCA